MNRNDLLILAAGRGSRMGSATKNIPKIEVDCPACDRRLRMKKKPGRREVDCPACDKIFFVQF